MTHTQSPSPITSRQMDSVVTSSNRHTDTDTLRRSQCISTSAPPTDGTYVCGARRIVFLTLAGVFFVLGMIGVVLPGLPTTPFLLLTSYFLARSWPRMHRMLLANKRMGPILCKWHQHRAVEPRVKLRATILVGIAMAMLIYFSNLPTALLATVLALASIGLLVIHRLPTVEQDESVHRL